MKKAIKALLAFLLGVSLIIGGIVAIAEDESEQETGVVVQAPTNDTATIYERYKDNSFQLLTKEATSLTGIKAAFRNASGIVKELVWSGVMNIGKFNTSLVKYMFSLDMETPIKKPMLNITAQLATGMLSIASGIGILSVTLVMVLKFAGEQNLKGIFRTFLMTIAIFASLVLLSSSNKTEHVASFVVDADNAVESVFITINPIFTETEQQPQQNVPGSETSGTKNYLEDASNLIAAKIFRSSVYEPYLIFNYGTSNTESIRRKTVVYKDVEYDRIGILLDNDFDDSASEEIFSKVAEYESEELKNKTISWKNNLSLAVQGIFYLFLNLVQTVIYFVLCILRLILVFLRWLIFPLLPVVFILGLFNFQINVFKNGTKAFVTVIGLKGLVSFAMVFVASYMSLGYNVAAEIDDPFTKIITILVYLCMPVGIVFFRHIIGSMISGNLSVSDLGNLTRHPFRTASRMNRASKRQASAARKQRKYDRKKRKNDKKDREEEEKRKQNNDFKQTKNSKSERSNKRSTDNKEGVDDNQMDKQKTPDDNIGSYRRYRAVKPVDLDKKTEKQKSKRENFSARRNRRPINELNSNQSVKDKTKPHSRVATARDRWNKMHEDSRYDDLVTQRNVPERQRIKKSAQQRQMKRQQEKMRVTSVGRSPRRMGQSTQPVTGEFRQVVTNTHKSAGKRYKPATQVQEVVIESKRRQTGQSAATKSVRKRVVRQTIQETDQKIKIGKQKTDHKSTIVKKGVNRRRV